jgi:hypothetical protein
MEPERPDLRRKTAPYWVIVISSGCVVGLSLVAAIVEDSAWAWFTAAVAAGLCASGVVSLGRARRAR